MLIQSGSMQNNTIVKGFNACLHGSIFFGPTGDLIIELLNLWILIYHGPRCSFLFIYLFLFYGTNNLIIEFR